MGKCNSIPVVKLNSKNIRKPSKDIEGSIIDLDPLDSREATLTKTEKSLVSSSLRSHYLFSYLSPENIEKVCKTLKFCTVEPEEVIFSQGSIGQNFYIINSGEVEVHRDGELKIVLTKGKTFGEMALLTSNPRRATIKTRKETGLWVLNKNDFLGTLQEIHNRDYEENKAFIENLALFRGFSEKKKYLLTISSIQHMYPDNQRIICENDEGQLLFILKKGKAVAKYEGIERFRIKPGELFGESVILSSITKYTNSVYSVGEVQCLSIDILTIRKILGENFVEVVYKSLAKHSISSDKTLGAIPYDKIEALVESMEWLAFAPEEVAVSPDYNKEFMIAICVGSFRSGEIKFSSNQAFGLGNKNFKYVLTNGLTAETDSVVGVLYKDSIEQCIKVSIKTLKNQLKLIHFLSKVEFLSNLTLTQLKYLTAKIKIMEFDTRETIYNRCDPADSFFILYKGKVEILSNNKSVRVLKKYDIFGESCIKERLRSKTARTITNVLLVKILVDEYTALIENIETRRILRRKSLLSLFRLNQCVKISKKIENSYELKITSSLGKPEPAFTVVVINKSMVDSVQTCARIAHALKIATYTEHSFLLKYVNSFIDSRFVYIFYEHDESIPFSQVPKEIVDEDYVKMISACLLTVLEYLHDRGIMFRDLSTDNVSLKKNGYPIFTTFSAAKIIKNKTYSIIGNPLFRAPEIHAGNGYTKSADLWSLGVFIFYHLFGDYPFEIVNNDSPMEIYSKILTTQLVFPKNCVLFKAQDLIGELLNKNMKQRPNTKVIKSLKWYSSVDWMRISNEGYQMKYIPPAPLQKKKKKPLLSLQRYVNEKIELNTGRNVIKFNWEKYF